MVVSGETVVNEDGLRYADEFVRHKALDAFGDLYLAGAPIIGRFEGVRSGHRMNHRLLAALFAAPDAWCWDPAPVPAVRPARLAAETVDLMAAAPVPVRASRAKRRLSAAE